MLDPHGVAKHMMSSAQIGQFAPPFCHRASHAGANSVGCEFIMLFVFCGSASLKADHLSMCRRGGKDTHPVHIGEEGISRCCQPKMNIALQHGIKS